MPDGVTVVLLIYRSPAWLSFVLEGLRNARNETPFGVLVVANDPTPEIESDPRVHCIHRNADPSEHYLRRVYRAWNRAIDLSMTDTVVMISSDMYMSDYWLDELVANDAPDAVPTSLLVESGVIDSAFPEYVRNFGTLPTSFNRDAFRAYADTVRQRGATGPGRLFGPMLLHREQVLAVGGFPAGNQWEGGVEIPGDQVLLRRLVAMYGVRHITCLGSVVYHAQEGEMRDR